MSTLDPILAAAAALSAEGSAPTAALDLGVAAEVLQAQLQVGDLLAAIVLAPQGGNDLLSIFGQTVVAQLPPGVHPGETLLLQVTAFSGNQILVRNLGLSDPQNPPTTAQLVLPPPEEGAPQTATLRTIPPPAEPSTATASNPPVAGGVRAPLPIAPPRAVFVAASVQPVVLEPQVATARPGALPVEPQVAATLTAPELEARIVAARTGVPERSAPAPPAQNPKTELPQSAPAAASVAPRSAPPPIVAPSRPPLEAPIPPTSGAERLLAQLRVPATPLTLVAAKLVADSAAAVPRALTELDAVLARAADPIVAPLRSLIAFIARLDPGNERAFPEQIASYVSNVLDGGESKLVALLNALVKSGTPATAADESNAQAPAATQLPQLSSTTQAPQMQPVPVASSAAGAATAQASAVERAVALEHDLKTVLLALTQTSPEGAAASPALGTALSNTLVAVTAAQLNLLLTNANDPHAMSLAIPVFFREGGKPAQLRIARDAPGRKTKLDADNFHIGFILDTQSLGTIAIDLETVGRAVKLEVKTERANSALRFRDALGELRTRLEHLHYSVASARAAVLAPPAPVQPEPTGPPLAVVPLEDPDATPDRWDVRA